MSGDTGPGPVAYAQLCAHVADGQLVAVAPAVDAHGDPHLVVVVGRLPAVHLLHLGRSTRPQRARIAVRAVHQVRQHYGLH